LVVGEEREEREETRERGEREEKGNFEPNRSSHGRRKGGRC